MLVLPSLGLHGTYDGTKLLAELNPYENGEIAVLETENRVATAGSGLGNGLHSANRFQTHHVRCVEVIIDSFSYDCCGFDIQHEFFPPVL